MPEAALTDDHAAAAYNSDIEAWGERGWASVKRICQWFIDNGTLLPFDCR